MANSARRLLVNADDFGWSRSVNEGIVEAHLQGIVSSTSLLAAGHDFEHAIGLLHAAPELSVGVHLNIYRGVPVLAPERVGTLLGPDGRFPGDWRVTARRLVLGAIDLRQVEAEFSAAVERVIDAGITPSHFDSEKHLHHWPSVFDVVCRVAKRYSVPRVRVVREPFSAKPIANALTALGRRDARVARTFGLTVADATIGVTAAPTTHEALRALVRSIPNHAETIELVCHPGHVDAEFMEIQAAISNRLTESRESELATLTDPTARELIREGGCEVCASL